MATMAGEEPSCGEYQQADDEINCTTAGLPATLDQPNSLGFKSYNLLHVEPFMPEVNKMQHTFHHRLGDRKLSGLVMPT